MSIKKGRDFTVGLSFGSYKMKLNRELSLLCRLEVKHCVLDDSFGC